MTRTYMGLLSLHSDGEADDVLFLSSLRDPLAEELGWMARKRVSVRYWITDHQCTQEDAQKLATLQIMGIAHTDYVARYSEITGYLWTDEEIKVGGHDLLNELKSHVGKWLILEISRG